ncbi:MAG: histidine--tRNA ligase [Bacillota bacterium]
MQIKAPKGTRDILPEEIYKWQALEATFMKVCRNFGYKEIRVPVFEHTELYKRGVGDSTDIVQKEMYTFDDKAGRSLTLRPEGTAGVVRAFIENGMASLPQPVKLAYDITCYRYENVQKGRYREFHQFGVEAFGASGPEVDVEIISLLKVFLSELGLSETKLQINSLGCPTCRKAYNEALKAYLKPNLDKMCGLCKERYDRNPMRVIDCKLQVCKEIVKDAPALIDYICDECREHFEGLKAGLDTLKIEYIVNKNIVRGLDYYTKTVFEFFSQNVGTQGTICGGGRYDGLVEMCGGPKTAGIGFALGVERLLMEIEAVGKPIVTENSIDLFLVAVGKKANEVCTRLAYNIRAEGLAAQYDLMARSVKAQMKAADKLGAKYTIVIGDDEIAAEKAKIRKMSDGTEVEIGLDEITNYLKL